MPTLAVVPMLVLALAALPARAEQSITMKGSDTMVILNQRWAETYMKIDRQATIQVTGGGSGTGFASLLSGSTDICAASRPIKGAERDQIRARYGTEVVEIPVARDGVAVYLHKDNPVRELTIEQVRSLYTGSVTNWSALGGPDARVILYSRENNSGTYEFFKDHILEGRDFSDYALSLPGTANVANAVSRDRKGIGYGGSAYAKGIKYCGVKADADSPARLPTPEDIASGAYPVSRDLYFYLRKPPQGALKDFIGWVLGPEGQRVVVEVGYFPLRLP